MVIFIGVSAAVVLVCVTIHGTTLYVAASWLRSRKRHRFWHIGAMILGAMTAHLGEILLFTIAYMILLAGGHYGSIVGVDDPLPRDVFYFSAVTYTSTGYGDLTPVGQLRFLAIVEALTGLIMVAWTASVTFVVMQRYWETGGGESRGRQS